MSSVDEQPPAEETARLSGSVMLLIKCLIPSIAGLVLFLIPLNFGETTNIPLAYITNKAVDILGAFMNWLLLAVVALSFVLPIIFRSKKQDDDLAKWLRPLLHCGWGTILIRGTALAFILSVQYQLGPEWLWGKYTGELVVNTLLVKLLSILFFASVFLPMLTEYGLMDFVGTLLRKPFRMAFKLPGRAAIDSLASTLGSASVGIVLSNRQYEKGLYTWREATIISTCFSTVSVPFSLVVAEILNLDHIFLRYYAGAVLIIIVLALIVSRLPPLNKFEDTFINDEDNRPPRKEEGNLIQRALSAALERAKTGPGLGRYLDISIRDLSNLWFNVIPPVLAFATIAMVIVEYTPIFDYLAMPFVPLMELAQMENPSLTAKAILAGFADPFFPPLIGKSIESDVTRCVIAIMAVVQLIFMTETGVVLMKTKLQIRVWHLVSLFLLRTALAFPLAVLVANVIV